MAEFHLARAPFAYASLGIGACALAGGMIAVYAGPFAPQATIGTSLGEFTADFIKATVGGLNGAPKADPAPSVMTIDDMIAIAVAVAGVVSILIAVVAMARRESFRLATGALAIGTAALTFQFLAWLAMLICGVILLVALIGNFGGVIGAFIE